MSLSTRLRRDRAARPSVDALESRELLSAMHSPHTLDLAPTPPLVSLARHQPFGFPWYQYGFPFPNVRGPILPQLPATPNLTVSTVVNGEVNPYGVAIVPTNGYFFNGLLHPGDTLVSNFNNAANVQGTGTTIVQVSPGGKTSTFFTSTAPGLGLALGVLSDGFVVAGNAPTPDATFGNLGNGELQFIDRFGHVVLTYADPNFINAPWGLTINDHGPLAQVFVSNALTGAITRLDLRVFPGLDRVQIENVTQVASGYTVTPNAGAVVLAPAGLAFDSNTGTLYVASEGDNAIYAVAHADFISNGTGRGSLVVSDPAHMNAPVGLALATNGDLLTTNADAFTATPPAGLLPSALNEYTTTGQFVSQISLDPTPGGAFGLAVRTDFGNVTLATVNDVQNTLNIWTIQVPRHHHGWWY